MLSRMSPLATFLDNNARALLTLVPALRDGRVDVPNEPIIPFIEGDGTGPDIWRASQHVFDSAVKKAYGGRRRLVWFEVPAGEKAFNNHGEWLPNDTLEAVRAYKVAIKGPLTTPVGGGIRSLNVALRQLLDLFACVRPVRYFSGTPAPVTHPERMNVVIFRENTEDVYAGIEWAKGTPEARKIHRDAGCRVGPPPGRRRRARCAACRPGCRVSA